MTECALIESNSKPRIVAGSRIGVWVLLILALVSIGVYANSLVNGFALDDVAIVQHNDRVNSLEWTRIWTENYWPAHDGESPDILYRPLTIWSYLATQAVAPDSVWAHHLGNVLLHALVTIMAALLAWRILGNRVAAILTGLLFALHPMHTEVVANVVGRAELLSTVFTLAALLVFLPEGPLLEEGRPAKRGYWHGWLVAACLMLGMLSKETPVALVGAFVFIDLWRWSHWEKCDRPTFVRWMGGQTWRYYVPLLVAVGAYLALRIKACGLMSDVHNIHFIVNPLVVAGPLERIITPFAIFTKYLHVMLWPAVLCADYSFPSFMPVSNPLAPSALVGILLTALAGIGMVKLWRKAPQVVLAIGLFAFSYALAANVLRIGTIMGERLFYLPSLFVLMLMSWAAVRVYEKIKGKVAVAPWRWAAIGLAATVLGVTTVALYTFFYAWATNALSNTLTGNVLRIGTSLGERLFLLPSLLVLMLMGWAAVRIYGKIKAKGAVAPGRWAAIGLITMVFGIATIALFTFFYALATNALLIGTLIAVRPLNVSSLVVLVIVALLLTWPTVRTFGELKRKIVAAPARWAAIGLTGAVCVAMTVRTVIRNTDWHDNIPLAIATARDNPGSAKACYWAGNILAMDGPDATTQAFGAQLLEHAIELYPEYGLAYFELAKYEGRSQHLAKSLIRLSQAAEYSPGVNDVRTALTAIKKDLRDQAAENYMPELRAYEAEHPVDPAGEMALGVAYSAQGKLPAAETALTKAITLQGRHFHEAVCELAQVQFANGHQEQAIALLEQYVDHVRINLDSRCMLAGALLLQDPRKYPKSLEMAQYYLDQADVISNGNPHVRELKGELSKKRAALNGLRPLAGEEPTRSVSLGHAGGGI